MTNNEYTPLIENYIHTKGLVRQHINSFNYFITTEIRNIMNANSIVDSDVDPTFYLKYTNIWVEKPKTSSMFGSNLSEKITPFECRLRDESYLGAIMVDIEYLRNKDIVKKNGVCIGKIPIMLRSVKCHLSGSTDILQKNVDFPLIGTEEMKEKFFASMNECPLDTGGYFIVRGVERVILIQEQLSKNRILLEDIKGVATASVTSSTAEKKSKTLVYYQEKSGELYVKNNSFQEDVPFCVIVKAMGIHSDQSICQFVGESLEPFIEPSVECANKAGVFDTISALNYIGDRIRLRYGASKIDGARTVVSEVVLPNVECSGPDLRVKGIYLCIMARRVLQAIHMRHNKNANAKSASDLSVDEEIGEDVDDMTDGNHYFDDKDFTGNKRFELAGQLLSLLFEDQFIKFNSELKKCIDKVFIRRTNAQNFDVVTFMNLQVSLITMAFTRAISTGNWVVKRFKMERAGVTQVLTRLSYISALGMMSRINSQFEKTRKVSGPRALHTSQWGYICPSDTPEGESCGLVKNLALMSEITTDTSEKGIKEIIFQLGCKDINIFTDDLYRKNRFLVFLNGMIIGFVDNHEDFVKEFRKLRRTGKIDMYVSIFKNNILKNINISCDGGRITRPLIIVDNFDQEDFSESADKMNNIEDKNRNNVAEIDNRGSNKSEDVYLIRKKYKDFEMLVQEGKIEYLDTNESGDSLIALNRKEICSATTHMEIEPFTILGTVAGLIPFPDHNQSPRNTYQCAMGKQAMGFIAYNLYKRYDTLLYVLTYSMRPMVKSKTIDLINFDKIPAGQNAIVAVMSFSGYDIEDALILNRNSIDRGFGRCEVYKNYTTTLKRYLDGSYDRIVRKTISSGVTVKKDQNIANKNSDINNNGLVNNIKSGNTTVDSNNSITNHQNSNVHVPIENKRIMQPEEMFYLTPKDNKIPGANNFLTYRYSSLDNDGISGPGAVLNESQIYVNLESPSTDKTYKFSGQCYKNKLNPSVVDKVLITKSGEDHLMIKSLLRQVRRPEIGDKFSSRHGQKGVVGLIVNQEDMPFSESGICPDMIMNPHGFPSRMTVGKILELVCGKAGLLKGRQIYSTPFIDFCNDDADLINQKIKNNDSLDVDQIHNFIFDKTDNRNNNKNNYKNNNNNHNDECNYFDRSELFTLEEIKETLTKNGFSYTGKDMFYSGITGHCLPGYVFFGPIYYQKLKHMVSDKIHGRARGPRAMLTRQPTEGRARDGGLRLGEMERDCLIGYGASNLLIERLLISSDVFTAYVCKFCGVICYKDNCLMCKKSDVQQVRLPYACKLLFQELMSMNILPKINLK
ncbi:hypothetical protein EDEG_05078 [Edhazardia aedis USNM 41457]|uniref:DNA-directed RNA polymerase subunit beta n=1 Tax=Edhazardia aedis (strain USNM 41457) TaxID=1003232 RepID=A0A0L1P7B6_EDHAE|nr:hypothetical protein EDEG_05078 [Edhazardia aedis USNM 41457]|eukprot:KNH48539.1 hypothetical protein EDEG_05078 [Edhazardia aedis USNM 41457]